MRITSPKNIPLKNFPSTNLSRQTNSNQKDDSYQAQTRQAFQSRPDSIYTVSLAQESARGSRVSSPTDTFVTNHSGRSRSNHHGISMVRQRAIKIDNIYEPQDFGPTKNSQSHSTKSITAIINRNTKSTSRITRATSPTTTTYPQRKQSQYTANDSKASFGVSLKEITHSYAQDTFDFKDLKKQISKSGQNQNRNSFFLPQNQDYYGHKNQLTQNRHFLSKNQQYKDIKSNNSSYDYNFQQKSLSGNGSKQKGLKPTMKPFSPSSNSKLGWRDVVKK